MKQVVPIVALILGFCTTAESQTTCSSPPARSVSVTPTVSSGLPAMIDLTWAGVPTSGPAAVTSYIVEVGTDPALANVARIDTGTAGVTYSQPAANGTYYIRIRAKNACGMSEPSPEVSVVVTSSTLGGTPAARAIPSNSIVTRDIFGDVMVIGEVRGALGSREAAFVKVTASFTDSAGRPIGSDFTYVNGRSRRLRLSRIIDDTTIGGAESACFLMYTDIPAASVARTTVNVSWSTSELEVLRGNVVVHSVRQESDFFGDLKTSGQLRNAGTNTTYFNEVIMDVRDARNRVIDCDFTYVDGSTIRFPSGISTDTALSPGQIGPFVNYNRPAFADVSRVTTWTVWDEADGGTTSRSSWSSWWRLVPGRVVSTLNVDPKDRHRVRNQAIEQLHALAER